MIYRHSPLVWAVRNIDKRNPLVLADADVVWIRFWHETVRVGLRFKAQARAADDVRQPATSRQTESAIPRCPQRFVDLIFHLVINPTLSNVPNISPIEIEYKPELSTKSNRLRRCPGMRSKR